VTSKCIYKMKHVVDGSVEKYKEIFVARVFSQVEGIHYEEKFSPLNQYTSIRMIISLATSMGWRLHQMEVKTTFLNGDIEEEFYINQLDRFLIHEKASHVYRIEKALLIPTYTITLLVTSDLLWSYMLMNYSLVQK
jgi:hypothetical protein